MPHSSIVSKIAHEIAEHHLPLAPSREWWQSLPVAFHERSEVFELERRDALRVATGAALDVGLRTAVASVLVATSLPRAFRLLESRRDLEDAAMYTRLLDAGRGREFFVPAPRDVVFHERRPEPLHFKPEGGQCVDLAWDVSFLPYNPRIRERYLSYTSNLAARARYWRHDGPARPTLIVVHGFVADAYVFNEWLFQLRWFYERLGLDIVCLTLPFHGPRRGRHSSFSGQLCFSQGVSWTAEVFRQAVMEFRALVDYLERERGAPAIGLTGISLGGYTTALLASLEPRLAFAIPNVPIVSMPDVLLEWNPIGTMMKLGMRASRVPLQEARHMMAIHCALSYEPVIPRERLLIIGGVGDRLAPPKHAQLLWEHWKRPAMHWFPGNHILHLDQGEYLRYIARFLNQIEFLPRSHARQGHARSAA